MKHPLSKIVALSLAVLAATDALGIGEGPLPDRCVSKVVLNGGRPRLEINGKPVTEQFFVTEALTGSLDVLPDVANAGYQVVGIPFYASKSPRARGIGPVWIGEREYDWMPLDARFAEVRSQSPSMKVILYLMLDAPVFWLKSHPGEVVVYEDGHAGHQ